jgi:hypothetical protein
MVRAVIGSRLTTDEDLPFCSTGVPQEAMSVTPSWTTLGPTDR